MFVEMNKQISDLDQSYLCYNLNWTEFATLGGRQDNISVMQRKCNGRIGEYGKGIVLT